MVTITGGRVTLPPTIKKDNKMSTNFKSGVVDVRITRFAGKGGANLMVSRPCEQDVFDGGDVWERLRTDSIRMTLIEARQLGQTLIALSSNTTADNIELDHE
jgi:hypothetical protein